MRKNKVCGVYKIENLITGDFYIGSSKDVKNRWASHKSPSSWKRLPNSPMYYDMQKYGIDKFRFQILAQIEPEHLKEIEQEYIEMLRPSYNNYNAKGIDIERIRKSNKKAQRKYYQSDRGKNSQKNYLTQPCSYNGETLTLCALAARFQRAGIEHPTVEAKKYLITK